MENQNLKGKLFELLNIDGSVMESFIISHCKTEIIESKEHSDGTISPQHTQTLVSQNGSGWHIVHGGNSDRITNPLNRQDTERPI